MKRGSGAGLQILQLASAVPLIELAQTNTTPSRSDHMTDSWKTNKETERDNSGDKVSRFILA